MSQAKGISPPVSHFHSGCLPRRLWLPRQAQRIVDSLAGDEARSGSRVGLSSKDIKIGSHVFNGVLPEYSEVVG